MSILKKLFGGGEAPKAATITYEGFAIYPEPIREGTSFRIAARIEKEIDGEVKSHQLIRADTLESQSAASDASVNKAKQIIDEQGDALFR